MYEYEMIKAHVERIKELTDEISKLKKQRRESLELLMDLDSQIVKAISLLEKLDE